MRIYRLVLVSLVSSVVFGFGPVNLDNPALYLEDVWAIAGFDTWMDLSEGSNIFKALDVMDLILGNEITFDASRLEDITGDLNLSLSPKIGLSLGTGFFKWAVSFEVKLDGKIGSRIPKSVAEILLEGPDYEENVNETFKLFKGSIFLKGGFTFASRLKWFDLGASIGVYYPVIHFDPNSSTEFVYLSDPETGEVHASVSGEERFYTAFNGSADLDLQNPGIYADVGLVKRMGMFDLGFAVSNISLMDSIAHHYGSTGLDFQATVTSGVPEIQGPEFWSSGIQDLSDPVSLAIQMKFSGFLKANLGILSLGVKGDYTPATEDWNLGVISEILKIVWLDLSYSNDGYWKKSVVLDIKLLILRTTLGFGIVDNDLFNLDPKRFEGFSVKLNFGLGI